MKKLITTILAITFLFSSCGFADNRNKKAPSESKPDKQNQEVKVIAAWIYYNEIEEFVKSSNTEDEFTQKVENAIDKSLSDFEKQVLNRYIQGESYVQIAEKLDAPVKSIDNAIQRIRKKAIKNIGEQ